jgi:hypothetical protein
MLAQERFRAERSVRAAREAAIEADMASHERDVGDRLALETVNVSCGGGLVCVCLRCCSAERRPFRASAAPR